MDKIVAKDKEHIIKLIFKQNILANDIDVSNVTDMGCLFLERKNFNQDISSWDVSNVTDMRLMFYNCSKFNQDIGSWSVSNVTNMRKMFFGCTKFNQDIRGWDISNATDMNWMFLYCPIEPKHSPKHKPIDKSLIEEIQDFPEVEIQFTKYDQGKARFDLIDPYFHEDLAKVLTMGANKYSDNNWQKGEIDRYIAATERHLNALKKGENEDPESGISHTAHASTNLMFIHYLMRQS